MRKKLFLVSLIIGLLLGITSCSDDRKLVNLALKKGEKVYLLPYNIDKNALEKQLSEEKTPTISNSAQIIEDRGAIYVEPKDFEKIVNLIAGNYVLFEEKESSHDGYVALDDKDIFEYKINNVNTEKIGQQIKEGVIQIYSPSQTKSLEIVWNSLPEPKAKKNCIVKRLWVVKHPYPGKTVGDYQNAVVINLNDIVAFYDNGTILKYEESDEILYIIQ